MTTGQIWIIGFSVVSLALVGCAADAGLPEADINLAPLTLEEAQVELSKLDQRLHANPRDAKTIQQARQLSEHLDQLNGAVARVDLSAEHSVTFFESAPGLVTVRERHPRGMPSVLPGMNPEQSSSVQLFKQLAPSREVPPALVEADTRVTEAIANEERASGTQEPQVGGGMSSVVTPPTADEGRIRSALTAADGPWFRDNRCPTVGFDFCFPNWANGGFAEGSFGFSRFNVAPFSGGIVSVRRLWNGRLQSVLPVFVGEDAGFWQKGPPRHICDGCATLPTVGRHRWEITDAIGDSFHWGGNMQNGVLN